MLPLSQDRRRFLFEALHVGALSSFAVAQPVFDLLGRHPTFLVAHGSGRREILLLVAVLVVVPPALLLAVEAAVGLVSRRWRNFTHVAIISALVALVTTPPLARLVSSGTVPTALLFVATAVASGVAYQRLDRLRMLLDWTTPAPLIFTGLFLLASPVSSLVFPSSPAEYIAVAKTETPVVILTFDEFALATLMTPDGEINAERFPNFGRLARTSTWYSNATTLHEYSGASLTAFMTGKIPPHSVTPTVSEYSNNMFTLLAGTHDLRAFENVTAMCPPDRCERDLPPRSTGTLLEDTAIAYLHTVLPADAAGRWLPAVNSQWTGFGDDERAVPPTEIEKTPASDPKADAEELYPEAGKHGVELARFDRFVETLGTSDRPSLSYIHLKFPHRPWRFLPDGTLYPYENLTELLIADGRQWLDHPATQELAARRFMLQAKFADRLLGRALDRLSETDMFDRSLVIVAADHGIDFEPGVSHRFVDEGAPPGDVIPVPLFVKLPRQTTGEINDRNVEHVDILPTVADAVGVDVPFDVDGTSLLGPDPDRPKKRVRWLDDIRQYPRSFAARLRHVATEIDQIFGDGASKFDLYAPQEYFDVMGRPVDEVITEQTPRDASARITSATFRNVDRDASVIPARVAGTLVDVPESVNVGVAINGEVAGIARSYVNAGGAHRFEVFVDSRFFRNGANDVEIIVLQGQRIARIPR